MGNRKKIRDKNMLKDITIMKSEIFQTVENSKGKSDSVFFFNIKIIRKKGGGNEL